MASLNVSSRVPATRLIANRTHRQVFKKTSLPPKSCKAQAYV